MRKAAKSSASTAREADEPRRRLAVHYVTAGNPPGLQEAISTSAAGDVIMVGPGVHFSPPGGFLIDGVGTPEAPLTIRASDPGSAIIDGNQTNRGVHVGCSSHVLLMGLVIRGGRTIDESVNTRPTPRSTRTRTRTRTRARMLHSVHPARCSLVRHRLIASSDLHV
jgi:hypothetical protein